MINFQHKQKSITVISDTHGHHQQLQLPHCDILIHCGDASENGNEDQLKDFFSWFAAQPATYKIFVAGNHDLAFDIEPERALKLVPSNVNYLENSLAEIENIKIVSVPARPWLHFMPEVPQEEIDILITHGPAYSILDAGIGCKILLDFIHQIKLKYHLFGHIHEFSQQIQVIEGCHFMNACIWDKV